MTAEFLFNCVGADREQIELLQLFTQYNRRKANKKQKRAIITEGTFTRFMLFKDWHVRSYQMNHNGRRLVCVVHSAIEYIFEITN